MPGGQRWLVASAAIAGVGAFVVLLAFGLAGGGDRRRPHPGLLDADGNCVAGDVEDAPRYDPLTGRPTPFPACPDLRPDGLTGEYVLAWIGLAFALGGSVGVLLGVTRSALPRGVAYACLGGVSGGMLLVGGLMALSSLQIEISVLGSEPDPWDAFDRIAVILVIAGVVLFAAGALVRQLVAARREPRPQG
jgi:hypothetical protein